MSTRATRNYSGGYDADSLRAYLAGRTLELAVCWKLTPRIAGSGNPVPWRSLFNVTPTATGGVTKASGNSEWASSGASGRNPLATNQTFEFTLQSARMHFVAGLSTQTAITTYSQLNFCWTVDYDGVNFPAHNSAVAQGPGGTTLSAPFEVSLSSKLGVRWTGTSIEFLLDGVVRHTVTGVSPSSVFYPAFSGYDVGAGINASSLTGTGVGLGATSHTDNLVLAGHPGVVFRSAQGVIPTAVDHEAGQESSGMEVESAFDSDRITDFTIARGDWDGAEFEIFILNYAAPTMGEIVQFSGTIGEITRQGQRFRAEGRPLTAAAQARLGYLYTPRCQEKRLGGAGCRVNTAINAIGDDRPITVTGTVSSGGMNDQFVDTARTEEDGYFSNGWVRFGGTINKEVEIAEWHGGSRHMAMLALPLFTTIPTGTPYTMERGCRRTIEDCDLIYKNVIRIVRAFPHLPGPEKTLRIRRVS